MKKILVPTDFSDNAYNALKFAVAFANEFGSQITLIHTFKLYSSTGMFISVESYMEEDAHVELAEMIKNTRPKLTNGATIKHKLYRGDAAPVIGAVAEKEGYDLIIMGTQGASGLKEVFSGSTTNGVVKACKVPLLMIPEHYSFKLPGRIVFAIDQDHISNDRVVAPLVTIAKTFGAKIEVFHQDAGSKDAGIKAEIRQFLDPVEASYHFRLDGQHITASIDDFVEETKSDLLCMIRRERSFLEKIFHQSVTTMEVFHSKIPLLVLHDPAL
ncbi:MAG: universal stress protein [Saprospiraceae bacterium]|nr:universal stress protein [Lewinella sp.]